MSGVLPAYSATVALSILPYFVNVGVSAQLIPVSMLLLYIGCHLSLRNVHRPGQEDSQQLASKDAYMFPVFGSIALLTLYCAYKYLPPQYLNMIVSAYFFLAGLLALTTSTKTFISTTLSLENYKQLNKTVVQFRVPKFLAKFLCDANKKDDDLIELSKLDFPCAIVSACAAVWYLTTKHALSNNLFGIAFCIQALSLITLDSFYSGAALLLGLFFYDIFFVFATDVMVTVATKFDAPIKLFFPRGEGLRPSMLGLGDIVIPGIFLSLMLRIDHHRHCSTPHQPTFSKPYFLSGCVGYFIGIAVTLFIMFAFDHAQPALLYLVPGCLISVTICAIVRGEFRYLMTFKDEAPVRDIAHED